MQYISVCVPNVYMYNIYIYTYIHILYTHIWIGVYIPSRIGADWRRADWNRSACSSASCASFAAASSERRLLELLAETSSSNRPPTFSLCSLSSLDSSNRRSELLKVMFKFCGGVSAKPTRAGTPKVRAALPASPALRSLLRQDLYFCTSKASKLSTCAQILGSSRAGVGLRSTNAQFD